MGALKECVREFEESRKVIVAFLVVALGLCLAGVALSFRGHTMAASSLCGAGAGICGASFVSARRIVARSQRIIAALKRARNARWN